MIKSWSWNSQKDLASISMPDSRENRRNLSIYCYFMFIFKIISYYWVLVWLFFAEESVFANTSYKRKISGRNHRLLKSNSPVSLNYCCCFSDQSFTRPPERFLELCAPGDINQEIGRRIDCQSKVGEHWEPGDEEGRV